MYATEIKKALEREEMKLMLVGDQLAVQFNPEKMDSYLLGMLPAYREELSWLLKLEEALNPNKPYLSTSDSGRSGEILLVPTGCHPKYRYWLPPIKCVVVDGDGWLTSPNVKEWRPCTVEEILRELNASEELIAQYHGFRVTEEVLNKTHYGKIEDDWYESEKRQRDIKSMQSRIFRYRQLDTQQS